MVFAGSVFADDDGGKQEEEFVSTLFLATPATPQDQGELSISSLATHFERKGGREANVALGLGYGITDRLTLEAEAPYTVRNPSTEDEHSGFGDIHLSGLYNFFRTESTLASANLGINVPTGSKDGDLGTRSVEWEPSLLLAHRFGHFELDAGLGGAFAASKTALTYSLAAARPVGPVKAILELSGFCGSDRSVYLTPGVLWAHHDLEVSMGIPVGLNGSSDHWGIVFQISCTLRP